MHVIRLYNYQHCVYQVNLNFFVQFCQWDGGSVPGEIYWIELVIMCPTCSLTRNRFMFNIDIKKQQKETGYKATSEIHLSKIIFCRKRKETSFEHCRWLNFVMIWGGVISQVVWGMNNFKVIYLYQNMYENNFLNCEIPCNVNLYMLWQVFPTEMSKVTSAVHCAH